MFKLIYGRAGKGKTFYCLNEIKELTRKNNSKQIIYIVPEQYSFLAEKRLLDSLEGKGHRNVEVLSFKRLCFKLFNENGGSKRLPLNQAGKSILLYKIIKSLKDELLILGPSARNKGFINVISDTITELKRYNITPELFLLAIQNLKNEEYSKKLIEIYKIYIEYEKSLQDNYFDGDDTYLLVIDKISESSLLRNSIIYIDQFDGFTPNQYRIIKALSSVACEINICFCSDCIIDNRESLESDIYFSVKNELKKLISIINDCNLQYKVVDVE